MYSFQTLFEVPFHKFAAEPLKIGTASSEDRSQTFRWTLVLTETCDRCNTVASQSLLFGPSVMGEVGIAEFQNGRLPSLAPCRCQSQAAILDASAGFLVSRVFLLVVACSCGLFRDLMN